MEACSFSLPEAFPDESFIVDFEARVKDTIREFGLFNEDDKVLVAVSGGKDSTVLLYLLKKFGYDVEALTVDVHIGCYTKRNLENIVGFCERLNVPLHKLSFRKEYGYSVCYMTSVLRQKNSALGSCTVCGVLRRRLLNQEARKLGVDVIATGHNLDDEAQSVFMNVLKNKMMLNARLGPKPKKEDESFIPRVKPLYFIPEADIEKYSRMKAFPVHYGRCPCSLSSTRNKLRRFFVEYERGHPGVKENIMLWFRRVLPGLREKYFGNAPVGRCSSCGEPASGGVCRACEILRLVKSPA